MTLFKQFMAKRRTKKRRLHVLPLHDLLVETTKRLTDSDALGIENTFMLRFEVMTFLTAQALLTLKFDKSPHNQEWSQALWDLFFEGLDHSLREQGVNDIRMAARMQRLFTSGTGRRNAYLKAWETDDQAALRRAIGRNILTIPEDEDNSDPRIDQLIGELETIRQATLSILPPG
ncbi:MAG: ubiquinol-cytochrome C chaperone family protein [Magnetococcales bacterium]|nr:ubiquinol-cytochrome C chaperone family protein [Magnetococcales bacterium]